MIKRILLSILLVCCIVFLCFFAFNKYKEVKKEEQISSLVLPGSFSANIKAKYGKNEYLCYLRKQGQNIEIEIEEPERLKGVTLNLTREEYFLSYKGIKINGDKLPDNIKSITNICFSIIDKLETLEYNSLVQEESIIILDYKIGEMNFSCSYNKETGLPVSIGIENLLELEFLEFAVELE